MIFAFRAFRILCCCMLVAAPLLAQAQKPAERTLRFRYKNVELKRLVEDVARAADLKILHDDTLRGRVSTAIARQVTIDEAVELMHSALMARGFAIVPGAEGFLRVLEIPRAVGREPIGTPRSRTNDERIVTIHELRSADVTSVHAAIVPLLGAQSVAAPLVGSNSLILCGSEARLHRLLEIVSAIDQGRELELMIRRIRHVTADFVQEVVEASLEGSEGTRSVGPQLWTDERVNSLIAQGSKDQLERVRALVDRLDQPGERAGGIRVIKLRHRNAEELAERIAEVSRVSVTQRGGSAPEQAQVVADPPTNSLLLKGSASALWPVLDLISELDQPAPLVEVDILISEISWQSNFELSLDGRTPFSIGSFDSFTNFAPNGTNALDIAPDAATVVQAISESVPVPVTVGGNTVLLDVATQGVAFVGDQGESHNATLMRPTLIAESGEEHTLSVGDNIPIPVTGQAGAGGQTNALQQRQTIDRRDIGVELRITPIATQEGYVQLQIALSVESLGSSAVGSIAQVGPTFEQRNLEATVTLAPNEVALLGIGEGSTQGRAQTGIPVLMSLPFFGQFFRSSNDTDIKTELVLAARARVLGDEAHEEATIRHRLGMERAFARRSGANTWGGLYGVRVRIFEDEERANALAQRVGSQEHPARVVPWRSEVGQRFDVTIVGYESLREAIEAVSGYAARGYDAELVPLGSSGASFTGASLERDDVIDAAQ